jgi:hypothetical protein
MFDPIFNLIIKNFSSFFNELWNSIVFWRGTILVIFLALLIGWKFRHKIFNLLQTPKKIEHDKEIFSASDDILKERQLREFLDYLGADHGYFTVSRDQLIRWNYYFDDIGHHYINSDLNKCNQKLKQDLNNLLDFTSTHFFVYPDHNQDKDNLHLCMYPELNIDRKGFGDPEGTAKYRQCANQLLELIKITEISYADYRNAIKEKLII